MQIGTAKMKTLQQMSQLTAQARSMSTADYMCALLMAIITILVYSGIIWLLWNNVLVRAVSGAKPISLLQALGVKILIDLLF